MDRMMLAPSVLLIVGTDTGVGKTWTGCALARVLCRGGRRVVAVKPVETGCPGAPAETEDGVALARATGQVEPLARVASTPRASDPIGSCRPRGHADRLRRSCSPRSRARRLRRPRAGRRRWRPSVSAHLGAQRGGPGPSTRRSCPACRGGSTRDDQSHVDGTEAPRYQQAGDSGCGPHRARATGRINWLECCRHLPTLGLFPYPLRATHARPESQL